MGMSHGLLPVPSESWMPGNVILPKRVQQIHLRRRDEKFAEWPRPKIGADGVWPTQCGRRVRGTLSLTGNESRGDYELCGRCFPGLSKPIEEGGDGD